MAIKKLDGTVTHSGKVVATYCQVSSLWEQDRWYAVVLADDGGYETVSLGSQRWASYGCERDVATIDAGAEAVAAYEAVQAEKARQAAETAARLRREAAARRVEKGKKVRVVRGRKVPRGTEGVVIWRGRSNYGGMRVGIKDAAGEVHWTAESNVEVAEFAAMID